MVTVIAGVQQGARNGCHPTRRAIGALGRFEGGQVAREHHDRGVEMTTIEKTAAARPFTPLEDRGHLAGFHDGEGGAGLDREVDASMLTKLVA